MQSGPVRPVTEAGLKALEAASRPPGDAGPTPLGDPIPPPARSPLKPDDPGDPSRWRLPRFRLRYEVVARLARSLRALGARLRKDPRREFQPVPDPANLRAEIDGVFRQLDRIIGEVTRRTAADRQKEIDAANEVQGRTLALLDRQEALLRRAELFMERLEKPRDSG
jgi:hypothetical protein